ncbi:MAG: hypothetical protein Q4C96_11225, partial [Planctomycetia bacterium]|nr:hypothetical protein [Planctomycetia bacterium]
NENSHRLPTDVARQHFSEMSDVFFATVRDFSKTENFLYFFSKRRNGILVRQRSVSARRRRRRGFSEMRNGRFATVAQVR